jgi:hypothetical protein
VSLTNQGRGKRVLLSSANMRFCKSAQGAFSAEGAAVASLPNVALGAAKTHDQFRYELPAQVLCTLLLLLQKTRLCCA